LYRGGNVATLSLVSLAVTLPIRRLAWRRVLMRACGLAEGRGEGGPAGIRERSLDVSRSYTVVALVKVLCNKVP